MPLTLTTVVSGFSVAPLSGINTNVTDVEFAVDYSGALLEFNAVWLFGDGTYEVTTQDTASHIYTAPGSYTVSLIVFNTIEEVREYLLQNSLSMGLLPTSQEYLTYTQTLSVTNYLTDDIDITVNQSAVLQARQAATPYTIEFVSSRNSLPTIRLFAEGSHSQPWEAVDAKWSHLKPQWRFVDTDGNKISTLTPATSSLKTLLVTSSNSVSAVPYDDTLSSTSVVGLSGSAQFYFIDDIPGTVTLHVTVDTLVFDNPTDPEYAPYIPGFSNSTLSVSTSCTVYGSTPTQLSITSNGLPTFTLEGTKWQKALTPYVISICDSDGYVLKNYPLNNTVGATYAITRYLRGINSSGVTFELPTAHFARYDDDGFDVGGYYAGFFQSLSASSDTEMHATCTVSLSSGTASLSGASVPFDILIYDDHYDMRKYNENFDMAATIKSYALQDTIARNTVLFDGFIGQIVGDSTSSPNDIGKSTYEKIANYVDNHANVDTCNIDKLYSLCQELGIPIEDYNFDYPADIKRVMNILSIAYGRLKGSRDKYDRDFLPTNIVDARKNLGDRLDSFTYELSAGTKVVINERHSDQYEIFNVVPLNGNDTYPVRELSAFNYQTPFNSYYKLYDYIEYFDDTQLDGVISWDDSYTTLTESISSIDVWLDTSGTVETILDYELRRGLELINN